MKYGDSLVDVFDTAVLEVGIPDGAYSPVEGDHKPTARGIRDYNASERLNRGLFSEGARGDAATAGDFAVFAGMDERNMRDLQAKADLYRQTTAPGRRYDRLKHACGLDRCLHP